MNIGIFDSGIGGITLLHQAMVSLPNEKYIFYADVDHVPYGTKSKEDVVGFVDEVMKFMIEHNCKAVVIACNTATAVAIEIMRQKYNIPIIGIEPAVKPAVENSEGKRVMVVATPLTVQEKKLKTLLDRVDDGHLVDLVALPRLVEFAERNEFDSQEVFEYIKGELSGFDLDKYGELVLGCTHFNYFKESFLKLWPSHICMIDGSEGTIRQLARVLEKEGKLNAPYIYTKSVDYEFDNNETYVEYYKSGRLVKDKEELDKIFGLHQRLERMRKL